VIRTIGKAIDCHLCGRIVTVVRSGVSGKLARHKCPHGTWCQAGGIGGWSKRRSTICRECRQANPQETYS
jgi:hypothetical protein